VGGGSVLSRALGARIMKNKSTFANQIKWWPLLSSVLPFGNLFSRNAFFAFLQRSDHTTRNWIL
jgi:hypothetical protein